MLAVAGHIPHRQQRGAGREGDLRHQIQQPTGNPEYGASYHADLPVCQAGPSWARCGEGMCSHGERPGCPLMLTSYQSPTGCCRSGWSPHGKPGAV